jgi:hypothetical protein
VKAHVERDFVMQTAKVWVVSDDHRQLLRVTDYLDPVSWRWDPIEPGQVLTDPTIVLPEAVLAAMVAAAMDVLPADRAQATHLADAIKVRDALLALVVAAHPTRGASEGGADV